MNRKLVVAALASGLGLFLAPQAVFAQADPVDAVVKTVTGQGGSHVADAKEHARGAVGAGADQKVADLVEHASAALEHAQAAAAEAPKDKHLKAAVHCLKAAVAHGKKGHLKVAKKHADDALKHLDQVK